MLMDIQLSSVFWLVFDKLGVLYIVYPVLILFASFFWVTRFYSKRALLSMTGALLVVISMIVQLTVESVLWHQDGGFRQPVDDQNALIYWFFFHGVNTGLTMFSVAILFYFLNKSKEQ